MRDDTDRSGQTRKQDTPSSKGLSRRKLLFAGGASLTAAAITSGLGSAWANTTDKVTRIQPIAVKSGGFPGAPWYRWNYDMIDQHRVAKRHGIAFRRPRPEVVKQDTWPPSMLTLKIPKGEENQPYVYLVSRCAAAAKLQDKSGEFLDHVSHMLWDGTVDNWPDHLAEYMNRAGMNGKAVLADVHANTAKYDAVFAEVATAKSKTGSGGVPEMVFRGEPFFGQDMFDSFFWRLAQNGLTRKDGAPLPRFSWTG